MRLNLYGQGRHSLLIDGIPVGGYADGDWLSVKENGNAGEITEGGDGPSMNLSVSQGGLITIGLFPTSKALGSIYGIRDKQRKTPRMFSILLYSGVDELIQASGCAFADLPQWASGGPKQTGRQFAFACLSIKQDTSAVEALVGGFVGGLF